jgi:hypothetical protein
LIVWHASFSLAACHAWCIDVLVAGVYHASSQIHPLSVGKRLRQRCGTKKDWHESLFRAFQRKRNFVMNEMRSRTFTTPTQYKHRGSAHSILDLRFPKVSGFECIDV